jgi:hypothetical protein
MGSQDEVAQAARSAAHFHTDLRAVDPAVSVRRAVPRCPPFETLLAVGQVCQQRELQTRC